MGYGRWDLSNDIGPKLKGEELRAAQKHEAAIEAVVTAGFAWLDVYDGDLKRSLAEDYLAQQPVEYEDSVTTGQPRVYDYVPNTAHELEAWLNLTRALPEAEAYRYLDERVADEIISGAAERIFLDIKGGYYTAAEATDMHFLRQSETGMGAFVVAITGSSREVITSVDLAA